MHCNLRPPEPLQPFPASRFNYDTMPSLTSLNPEPAEPIRCRILELLLLIHYLRCDLDLWPCDLDHSTFDLEHLQPIACDVMKLYIKFERNWAICGGVIAISVFDLMTLNIALRVALSSGIIFTKFDLRQLVCAWMIAFLCWYVMSRYDLDLWFVNLESSWCISRHNIRDQSLYQIWEKSSNTRLNYW